MVGENWTNKLRSLPKQKGNYSDTHFLYETWGLTALFFWRSFFASHREAKESELRKIRIISSISHRERVVSE